MMPVKFFNGFRGEELFARFDADASRDILNHVYLSIELHSV